MHRTFDPEEIKEASRYCETEQSGVRTFFVYSNVDYMADNDTVVSWSLEHRYKLIVVALLSYITAKCNTTHGRSKRSGWSGFGWTSFHGHFWNYACADNE